MKTNHFGRTPATLVAAGMLCLGNLASAQDKRAGGQGIRAGIGQAGTNRSELEKALNTTPANERLGMAFLIANMPASDLRSLKAQFLRDNVAALLLQGAA